ncbi:MAG: hypothetical protein A2845_02695 [Candidatus Lloydbacteria bacterium RIFCSPHIGHO2_01_FULL_49_22]|uniref:Uncharacterized protein n=1 Tax=Candidatus Lloydbacteria bacterium RIFCSPHIGHO2_01_FULL_49_22 TaxID=1798658 RepID=A0A1G2CV29_9BACT|nr:MAG: hypothetical protein A2845_02695 [Candidatus Lloydbacteria bacterium RIFCSPHIGHO2_01_FULL_49_22]OGZ10356.1 MAG: hypothetical protein A3C14_02395 [Candidatus Lloydbacteria bacterium RIFCSPHIGHO2_02_FULL_50_18]
MVSGDANTILGEYPVINRDIFLNLPPYASLIEDGTGHRYNFICNAGPEFIFVQRTIVTGDLRGWRREFFASIHPERDPSTITNDDVFRSDMSQKMGEYTLQTITPVHNHGDPQWAVITQSKHTNNPAKWTLCDS